VARRITQSLKQCPGFLEVSSVKALGAPAIHRRRRSRASARLPWCCHRRLRPRWQGPRPAL